MLKTTNKIWVCNVIIDDELPYRGGCGKQFQTITKLLYHQVMEHGKDAEYVKRVCQMYGADEKAVLEEIQKC